MEKHGKDMERHTVFIYFLYLDVFCFLEQLHHRVLFEERVLRSKQRARVVDLIPTLASNANLHGNELAWLIQSMSF